MKVYFTREEKVFYIELPDEEDVWMAIERYDAANGTDFWDHLDEKDILGVNLEEDKGAERVE